MNKYPISKTQDRTQRLIDLMKQVDEERLDDLESHLMSLLNPSYAERWQDSINATYGDEFPEWNILSDDDLEDGETHEDAGLRILDKAAQALRNGVPATFTGPELDLVRHVMPAHEVHQSGAVQWLLERRLTLKGDSVVSTAN